MLCSRFSFRLSVRQVVSRVILRGSPLRYTTQCPIWAHLFNFHLVEVSNLHLDALDGFRLINRADMKIDRDVAVHVEEVSQHPVIEFRREDLQEAHCADGLAHLEALAFTEVEGSGRDEIFAAESRPGYHVKGEAERLVRVHVEHIMEHFQPFVAGQRLGLHTEGFEIIEDVRLNPIQLGLRHAQGVGLNAEGNVLALDEAVVALRELVLQHLGILAADVVELVILLRDVDLLLELADARPLVDERELDKNRAVKVVQEVAPVLEDGRLVLVLGELIVDVVETDSLCIKTAVDLADAVAAHLHIGDGLLRRFADFLCLLVLFLLQDQLLLFLGGEKIAVHLAVFGKPLRFCGLFRAAVQSAIPPSL